MDSLHLAIQLPREGERQPATPLVVEVTVPKAWDERVAHLISQIGSPPVLATTVMALSASTLSNPRAWAWAGIYVFLAILTPLLYLIWLVHRGHVTDLDVQLREQRMRPMIFAIACTGLAWLVLMIGAAPLQVILAGALWLQMVMIFGITLWWKISVHCAGAAATGTVVGLLIGTPLPFLIGVPLIAWSRVRLRRHTLAQTVAGTLLGLTIFLAALSLVYGG